MSLSQKQCVPCEGGALPLSREEASRYLCELNPAWQLSDDAKKIRRDFTFADFLSAMRFVTHVADLAEQEQHHPDMMICYNKVAIELSTHAVKGLSENDFILAAKIDMADIKWRQE